MLTLMKLPSWLRTFLAWLLQTLMRDPIAGSTMRTMGNKTASQVNSWTARRDVLRDEWNDWFHAQKLDGIIAPVSAIPAAKINGTAMVTALGTATLLYNVLDWPVGVVPVTKVVEGEEMDEGRWRGREGYSWLFLDMVYGRGGVYRDIVRGGVGLPVGVQVFISFDFGVDVGYWEWGCWGGRGACDDGTGC
jgi:Amidase